MPKVVSKARQLRLNKSAHLGREVTLREVSEATGIHSNVIQRIESGKTGRIEFDTLAKLCTFYGVGVGDVLEYDPNNKRAIDLGAAVPALP